MASLSTHCTVLLFNVRALFDSVSKVVTFLLFSVLKKLPRLEEFDVRYTDV